MPNVILHYTRVNALVRAMISRLLQPADWQRLLAANDAEDVLRQLGETQYAGRVQGLQRPNLAELERALRLALLDAYDRLIDSLGSAPRRVVETLLGRQEVDNLKAILRAVVG
ncbi:MAG: V-type ATPase subunit, partial [Chloroflexota bacterium]